MNTILSGNLTKDVEIKYFESGKCKSDFSIAVNYYDASKKQKVANFYNCEAWGRDAEYIAETFKKGEHITILADYKQDKYTSQTGQEKTADKFVCRGVVYSGIYHVISGNVEKEETRYTQNNVKIQYIKVAECPITVKNLHKDISVTKGNYYTFIGELYQLEDKKLILDAKTILMDTSGRDTAQEVYQQDEVKLPDGVDEIPF